MSNNTIKVLFLDIDGVMHPLFPLPERSHAENQHWASLDSFLSALPADIVVVLASDWRKRQETIDKIPPRLLTRLAGFTPILGAHYDGVREDEALMWLEKNFKGYNVQWMALDDNKYLYRSHDKVLVCHDGFRDREHELWNIRDQFFTAPVKESLIRC